MAGEQGCRASRNFSLLIFFLLPESVRAWSVGMSSLHFSFVFLALPGSCWEARVSEEPPAWRRPSTSFLSAGSLLADSLTRETAPEPAGSKTGPGLVRVAGVGATTRSSGLGTES